MDLEIVVIIKGEIIHGENHTNEVTECVGWEWFCGRKCIENVHKH